MVASKVINVDSFKRDIPNLRINYFYRDVDNYKQYSQAIFAGTLSMKQATAFVKKLETCEGFVPSSVGIDDLQIRMNNGIDTDSDHPWHELTEISRTASLPTEAITAQDFFNRFMNSDQDKEAELWSLKHLIQ